MIRSRFFKLALLSIPAAALAVLAATALPAANPDSIGKVTAPKAEAEIPGKRVTSWPVIVYADNQAQTPWIYSGWMGEASAFHFEPKSTDSPHSGQFCIKVDFTDNTTTKVGGVAWMDPANDWGEKQGGYNLTGAKTLVFWARGAAGGEKVSFGYGVLANKKFHDTATDAVTMELTKDWRLYSINVADKDLLCIKTGFQWMGKGQGKPYTFYIDDVAWVTDVVVGANIADAKAKEIRVPMTLYGPNVDPKQLPYEPTGRIGVARVVAMNPKCTDYPRSGSKTCLKVDVKDKGVRAGAVWQDPPNDMGDKPGGHNLTGAGLLSFWARGVTGQEKVTFGYGLIGMDKKYADSSSGVLKDVMLPLEWKQFTIPLDGKDMSMIKTGFYWVVDGQEKPVTFFLDNIEYVAAPRSTTPTYNPNANRPLNNPVSVGPTPPRAGSGGIKSAKIPLVLYSEAGGTWPYQPTGWMGNMQALTMNMNSSEKPHSGSTCIRVDYNDKKGGAGVVWQDPANDWGDQAGGYNLSAAKVLTFWARGQSGGETLYFGVGMIGPGKKFPDSTGVKLENVTLTTEWKQYSIPLAGKDLSCIKSGFYWRFDSTDKPITFFLDDIQFE